MSKVTVYVKGDPGFMPAVITKLGREWIHNGRNVDEGVISFSLPEKMSKEEFKTSIGTDIVSDFNVLFFDDIPVDAQPEAPWKFVPGHPFRISIWADNDSKLTGTKSVQHSGESKT
jgi:hypothetical protein